MKRLWLAAFALFIATAGWTQVIDDPQISPTKYDYTQVARQITSGCHNKYEQAKAIYRWLCDNISYDTSFSIYTADRCWEQRKGVCQAYSELFYRLAEAVGMKTVIVRGDAKPSDGHIEGHAWIFAIVEGDNTGIMIDPTWGAGSVDGSEFTRSKNDNSWFHVNPYWMIFTHFPDDERFQMLPQPIGRTQFEALPAIKPMWGEYGLDAEEIFNLCMSGNADLPNIYNSGVGKLRITEMPMQGTLRVGERYRFAIQKSEQCVIALIDNTLHDKWQLQDGTYYIDYTPSSAGNLHLGLKTDGQKYATIIEYNIASPTADDLAKLEAYDPLLMPEVSRLDNFDAEALRKHGIDGAKLLEAVRNGSVKSLPAFYDTAGDCAIDEMPLNGTLQAGKSYTFTLRPRNGAKWAIINDGKWYRTWATDAETGAISMTVVPETPGNLVLAVQLKEGESYEYCISFEVK